MLAICASVQPTRASLVTAVPRRSLNVSPEMPALMHALPQLARMPSGVHGRPSLVSRMIGLFLGVASSMAFSGPPARISTRAPVFDWRKRICVPSYADPQEIALPLSEPQREQQ